MMSRIARVLASVVLLSLPALAAAGPPVASDAWARATPPGLDLGAVYLTIVGGTTADELVAASTARASMAHLHTIDEAGGMTTMRPVSSIKVPAGERVVLAPKGLHIMLMGLVQPLVAGESFPLTLKFAKSGQQIINVMVRPASAEPAAPAQH